jgi:hypothetical protein
LQVYLRILERLVVQLGPAATNLWGGIPERGTLVKPQGSVRDANARRISKVRLRRTGGSGCPISRF